MATGTLFGNENEQDILFSLATTNDYQSFDAEALCLKERGENLCRQKPGSASWLLAELFRSSVNPLGEEVLAGLIAGMDLEVARKVTDEHPQFLPSLRQSECGKEPTPVCLPHRPLTAATSSKIDMQ